MPRHFLKPGRVLRYCLCSRPAIQLPNGEFLKRDGAYICSHCLQIQIHTYNGSIRDSEILKHRENR